MVKRFTAALLKGLEYSLANPKEAAEILKKNVDATNPVAAAAELELMAAYVRSGDSGTAIGTLDSGRVAKSIAILQGAGALEADHHPRADHRLQPRAEGLIVRSSSGGTSRRSPVGVPPSLVGPRRAVGFRGGQR